MPSIVPTRAQTFLDTLRTVNHNLDKKKINPKPPVLENEGRRIIANCIAFKETATPYDIARMIFTIIKSIKPGLVEENCSVTQEDNLIGLFSPPGLERTVESSFKKFKTQEIIFDRDVKSAKFHNELVLFGKFIERLIDNKWMLPEEFEAVSDNIIEDCINKLHEYTENFDTDKGFTEPKHAVIKIINSVTKDFKIPNNNIRLKIYLINSLGKSTSEHSSSQPEFINNLSNLFFQSKGDAFIGEYFGYDIESLRQHAEVNRLPFPAS